MLAIAIVLTVTGALFTIGADNDYHRTELFPLGQALIIITAIGNLALVVRRRRQIGRRGTITLAACLGLVGAAASVQAFTYGLNLGVLAGTIAFVLVYAETQSDAAATLLARERGLASTQERLVDARIEAASSQIQPHFVGNTLGMISYLCVTDPERASQAATLLSSHLQTIAHSMQSGGLVPVEDELAHARDYLELRHMSSPDTIRYRIEATATDFSIPALLVLTLVENAVEHGLADKPGGGTVTIRTRSTGNWREIDVIDDGAGFYPDAACAPGETHMGLANARYRIEHLCGGVLSIDSEPGTGACVTASVPKRKGALAS